MIHNSNRAYQRASSRKTVNYDADYDVTFTASAGIGYPVYFRNTVPADRLYFRPSLGIQSLSMKAPLFSVYDAEVSFFWMSWRACIPEMRLNFDGYDPRQSFVPTIRMRNLPGRSVLQTLGSSWFVGGDGEPYTLRAGNSILDMCTVYPNSLFSWLGYDPGTVFLNAGDDPAVGNSRSLAVDSWNNPESTRNAIPMFMYYFIYYMYFCNWQVDAAFFVGSKLGGDKTRMFSVGREQYYQSVSRGTIRSWLQSVLSLSSSNYKGAGIGYSLVSYAPWEDSLSAYISNPRKFPTEAGRLQNTLPLVCPVSNLSYGNAAGLFVAPYRMSYYEHWINTSSFDSVKAVSSVEVKDGKLLIDDLIMQERVKKYLSLGFLGSANFRDWVHLQFGVTPRKDVQEPQYLGSFRQVLSADSIVNQAEDLGALAGLAQGSASSKMRRVNFDDYGTFMAIFTLTPRMSYLHQLRPEMRALNLASLPAPELCGIGWQPKNISMFTSRPYVTYQRFGGSSAGQDYPALVFPSVETASNRVVGYELAFAGYTTDVSLLNGDLTGSLRSWAFMRDFRTSSPASEFVESDLAYNASQFLGNVSDPVRTLGAFVPYCDFIALNTVFENFANTENFTVVDNFVVKFSLKGRQRRPIYKRAIPSIG